MNKPLDERQVWDWFSQNMPDRGPRRTYLSLFANAIREVHRLTSDQWSVTLHHKPRLIVGHYITYVGLPGVEAVWLALDSDGLAALDHDLLQILGSKQRWTPDKPGRGPGDFHYLHYQDRKRREISTNGTLSLRDFDPDVWSVVERLSFAFIARATDVGQRHRQASRAAHTPGVLAYMRDELGTPLPDPSYRMWVHIAASCSGYSFTRRAYGSARPLGRARARSGVA